jgi:hypothetical protein
MEVKRFYPIRPPLQSVTITLTPYEFEEVREALRIVIFETRLLGTLSTSGATVLSNLERALNAPESQCHPK